MLQHKLESLDGIDESLVSHYKKTDDGYVLDVGLPEEIVKADEHNKKLFEEAKKAKEEYRKALKEKEDLEKSIQKAEKDKKKERGEFEELYNQQLEANKALEEAKNNLENSMRDGVKNRAAENLANQLTRDTKKAGLLAEKIASHVEVTEDNQSSFHVGGVKVELDALKDHIASEYDFLVDGSAASGGGAIGSSNGGAIGKDSKEMSRKEKAAFINKHGLDAWQDKVKQDAA